MAEVTDTFATPLSTMIVLLIILFTGHFNQKYYINKGFDFGADGRVLVADSDRDGLLELILGYYERYPHIVLYELGLDDTFRLEYIIDTVTDLVWACGDFDLDGLFDFVTKYGGLSPHWTGLAIFESPDSFSYPTQKVWWDTVGPALVVPICVYDIDIDGLPEIVKVLGDYPTQLSIYESIGNNLYEEIAGIITSVPDDASSTLAFGDFDSDGQNEFSFGYIGGRYSIFECRGNNVYQEIITTQLPTANIKDCFTVFDADGDGKLEFVVKGLTFPDARFRAFIFEAVGNDTYQIVKTFVLSGLSSWDYAGGYSDVGDIDGDGIAEIVLEASANIYIIKSAGNDSFYVWHTLPGNPNGSSVRIFDIDTNGLPEIIISGGNHTRIYEKAPFVTWFCPEPYDTFYANDTVYPRWRLDETINLDSLRLYWSHPQMGCHLIYQGLPTDTICSWVVPDTQSNMSNRFWLVVKGFGRYDSTYSPVFYIKRQPGIEETEISQFASQHPQLTIHPNPFCKSTVISYSSLVINDQSPITNSLQCPTLQIYDATGRLVRRFNDLCASGGIQAFNKITWDGTDDAGGKLPAGVYFIQLNFDEYKEVAKVVKLN